MQGKTPPHEDYDALRRQLEARKAELYARLERITQNLRRGRDPDSKERAKELEDTEVVDALGNEARNEIRKITAALQRMEAGEYGYCGVCAQPIGARRLEVYPYAEDCIDCARREEQRGARR